MITAPWPLELRLLRTARILEIDFDDGGRFFLPASLLRAMTPSAADRGHGGVTEKPLPKRFDTVSLTDAQAVGAYAVRLVFDDGHDSGIYTWEALHRFGRDKDRLLAEHESAFTGGGHPGPGDCARGFLSAPAPAGEPANPRSWKTPSPVHAPRRC